jgi:RNA polymerase subunit RPABC4/transcription elongation factor Spt4
MVEVTRGFKIKLVANISWKEVPEHILDDIIELLDIKFVGRFPEGSTKQCPNCFNTHLLTFSTLNKKVCTDCDTVIEWKLDKNQKPIL